MLRRLDKKWAAGDLFAWAEGQVSFEQLSIHLFDL
jgi:hypothetical protein